MEFFGDMISALKRLLLRLRMHHIFLSPERLVYYDMLRERDGATPRNFAALSAAGQQGLVSIILPVYNGERYLREAIDSVRAQTYTDWELIVVDDGSTDASATIVQEYADNDTRIRLVRQENKKLPAALNTGHREARGEFLTWTSDDNRLKPDFLTVLVAEMQERPSVDMLFANPEAIDSTGKCSGSCTYYEGYQYPPGSGVVRLPVLVSRLHAWNSIGAAFLYRRRILPLVGLYSENWFTCEDYDFWLRVNLNAVLRHSHHVAPLYQYRVHGSSLTAAADDLGVVPKMRRMQRLHDARRDMGSGPVAWCIVCQDTPECRQLEASLLTHIRQRGDLFLKPPQLSSCVIPTCGLYITVSLSPETHPQAASLFTELPALACAALVCVDAPPPEDTPDAAWDVCLHYGSSNDVLPDIGIDRGWIGTDSQDCVWHALRARATAAYGMMIERCIFENPQSQYALSVILCTNRSAKMLARVVNTLAEQTLDTTRYEVIIVNNAPERCSYDALLQLPAVSGSGMTIRIVDAIPAGLDLARNAGMLAACGEVLLYLDDDVEVEADCLEHIVSTYAEKENLGLLGGEITLVPPERTPWWFGPEVHRFWTELLPETQEYYRCNDWRTFPYGALWSARRQALFEIGGFDSRYDRNGRAVDLGGETCAALSIQALGYEIGITPKARVRHIPEADRFYFHAFYKNLVSSYEAILLMQMENRIAPILHLHKCPLRGLVRLMIAITPLPMPIAQRSRNLALGMVQFHCSFLLMKNLVRRIAMQPAEWRDAP